MGVGAGPKRPGLAWGKKRLVGKWTNPKHGQVWELGILLKHLAHSTPQTNIVPGEQRNSFLLVTPLHGPCGLSSHEARGLQEGGSPSP